MGLAADTIIVSPIGGFDSGMVRAVRREITRVFGFATETIRLMEDVEFALDPARRQYHSTKILEVLAGGAPSHALKILGLTDRDLFIPILTYVYGEAQLGGRAAVISIRRLKDGLPSLHPEPLLLERISKEAVHELGHTFKLRHCRDKTCIMHYCRSIRDVDRKSEQLCRYCRILLEDEIKRLGVQG